MQDLDRHIPVQGAVPSSVHRRHAAFADFLEHLVTIVQEGSDQRDTAAASEARGL